MKRSNIKAMNIIGLTGSIAMGKSTMGAMLRAHRIPVFDSDQQVHNLLITHTALRNQIITFFPECFDKRSNQINRSKLGHAVFQSTVKRRFLESLIHPYIWNAQNRFLLQARRSGQKMVVLDIPLLFETAHNQIYHSIICVTAPPFLQKLRAMSRKTMTAEKLKWVLRSQWPSRHKEHHADYVVPTGAGFRTTKQCLTKILLTINKGNSKNAA